MTERIVYLQRVDPEHREAYVEAHEDVPDGVTAAMERGGVESFELYLRGDVAVCIAEVEDRETYLEAVTGDPDVEAWERHVAQFKREGVDPDAPAEEGVPFMDRIWSFEADGSE